MLVSDFFVNYKKELMDTLDALDKDCIAKIYEELNRAYQNENQIFLMGNGGSASAASHWLCDFAKGINTADSKRIRIFCLTDHNSMITAIGNDISYEDIFVEQLKNYLRPEDLVISFSVSGNSMNLINAHLYSQQNNVKTISIIGGFEGHIISHSDISLVIPSKNYGIVEDIHIVLGHVISQYMYKLNTENLRG